MNKLKLVVLFFLISSIGLAQMTETKFYSDKSLKNGVNAEKGKFSQTITKDDSGIVVTLIKDLKRNEIIRSFSYKGEEPWGIWTNKAFDKTRELDFNFSIIYSKENCSKDSETEKVKNLLEDNEAIGYVAPILATVEKTVNELIGRNLTYPSKAASEGIQGVVMTSFIITEEGIVKNIIVNSGIDILLDKEAVRILRKLKFSSPPMFNGQPREICVYFPISFKLI